MRSVTFVAAPCSQGVVAAPIGGGDCASSRCAPIFGPHARRGEAARGAAGPHRQQPRGCCGIGRPMISSIDSRDDAVGRLPCVMCQLAATVCWQTAGGTGVQEADLLRPVCQQLKVLATHRLMSIEAAPGAPRRPLGAARHHRGAVMAGGATLAPGPPHHGMPRRGAAAHGAALRAPTRSGKQMSAMWEMRSTWCHEVARAIPLCSADGAA